MVFYLVQVQYCLVLDHLSFDDEEEFEHHHQTEVLLDFKTLDVVQTDRNETLWLHQLSLDLA